MIVLFTWLGSGVLVQAANNGFHAVDVFVGSGILMKLENVNRQLERPQRDTNGQRHRLG